MRAADEIEIALRRRAELDDPLCAIACADAAAWARAEGEGSVLEAESIRRRDIERHIPGLPARRTYMAIGWVTVAAALLTSVLAELPQSSWVEMSITLTTEGVADVLLAMAAWSLLSEVRGWEGSDASTWHLRGRVKRFDKMLAARRQAICETLVAIRPDTLTVYRYEAGSIVPQTFAADSVEDISLRCHDCHMSLHLETKAAAWHFDWLRRDAAFEAEAAAFAALVAARREEAASATQVRSQAEQATRPAYDRA